MDSDREDFKHGSSPKRIKIDVGGQNSGGLCGDDRFSDFSSPICGQNDNSEALSATDCDSGYEASTMESMPTPSHQCSPFYTGDRGPDSNPCLLMDSPAAATSSILPLCPSTSNLLIPQQEHPTLNINVTALDVTAGGCASGIGVNDATTLLEDSLGLLSNLKNSRLAGNASDDDADEEEVDDEDNLSTVSELSGLSDLSGQDWKPMAGSMTWIQRQMHDGVNPRELLSQFGVNYEPHNLDDITLWKLIINMMAEPPRRHKLRHVNTVADIVRLLRGAKNVIVLTGAGVSVSCGIPDFRSRDGIYSRLAIDFPDLPDPQAMFDISYFNQDPRPFFKFARDIYPGKFQPSPCHRFIKLLEEHNKLLRNYTQNIDTLEKVANISKVIECHGSFATATCTKCSHRVTAEAIRDIVLSQSIPVCMRCRPEINPPAISITCLKDKEPDDLKELVSAGIMKPDIVFFGEGLPDSFHEAMVLDKNRCDLLLVIGSSLKVRPVALIPSSLPADVPQILINREPLPHCHFDIELLGDCDVIISHICRKLGENWFDCVSSDAPLTQVKHLLPWKVVGTCSASDDVTIDNLNANSQLSNFLPPPHVSSSSSLVMPTMETNISDDCRLNANLIKERHMSIDSARDSGIGDNSNFTDFEMAKYEEEQLQMNALVTTTPPGPSSSSSSIDAIGKLTDVPTAADDRNVKVSVDSCKAVNTVSMASSSTTAAPCNNIEDLRGYWQPKQKRSILERLPTNAFYLVPPSRYIFPGAELFYDPDEKIGDFDDEDDDDSTSSSRSSSSMSGSSSSSESSSGDHHGMNA